MPRKTPRQLTMEIDHRPVTFPEGAMVLQAAELNGVTIPSLCAHKDLSPFGGCRLCLVEIEGMRGYPLSCSTAAKEGMKVLTDTTTLRELRREILQLILSEHPSSCLVCDESLACRDYQSTIRKTGVATGCRFCPNDQQCELQNLIEKIGLTEIDYPIRYHGYEPEHDDPFYDRDYNVCILCGRCVRMCQEVRGTGVLAFTHRGPRIKIGPAFGRNHVEAGCEFCGACVDVCPTGALADKASKWEGTPDGAQVSTCPFCAVGCQIELSHKNGRLTKAKADLDSEVNDGQLCLKGRFCLPETTHHFDRAKKPMLREGEYFREVSWERILETIAGRLKGLEPGDIRMLVSADLTNESLFAAQKFVRTCLGSNRIDSSARRGFGGGLGLWSKLFALPISIKDIAKADVILAVGLDSRFSFSVVGTKVRKALAAGARLVTIDPRDSNLARYTDDWIRPRPGQEGALLKLAADHLAGRGIDLPAAARTAGGDPSGLERALEILSSGRDLTVIIGPRVFHYQDRDALVDGLMKLAENPAVNFIPLYFGTNARGALEMGVFPEVDPGPVFRPGEGNVRAGFSGGSPRPKAIYLVGDIPFFERPDCDFLIVQDLYLPAFPVDAFLPASSFAETSGTLVNMEGRVQEIVPVEHPAEGAVTGLMRPDWRIFSDLAKALACPSLDYRTVRDVYREIRAAVPDFPARADRKPRRMKAAGHPDIFFEPIAPPAEGRFTLVAEPGGYGHRGIDLSSKVGGLNELGLEEGFRMNPEDMDALGIRKGDRIRLSIGPDTNTFFGPAYPDAESPAGSVFLTRPAVFGGLRHRRDWEPLFRLSQNPVGVNIHSPNPRDGEGTSGG